MDDSITSALSQLSNTTKDNLAMSHKQNHRKIIAISLVVVMIMFSFSFVLVPLYSVLCRTTGLNGSVDLTSVANSQNTQIPNNNRQLTMQFVTTTNANLPWDFYPQKNSMNIHPEENNKMLFFVKNKTLKSMTVQAIPSVTPWQAARHLHKLECFCFKQQTVKAGESLNMPVVFRIDNDLPKDIKTITLAYTLFDVTKRNAA